MKQLIITLSLLITCAGGISAQSSPAVDTLQINSVSAKVASNGAFFLGEPNGHFLVPAAGGSAQKLSLLKSAGLWLGGRDSAGVLHLSAQTYNEQGKSDFYPGVLNEEGMPYPEFNFIADVTATQIATHRANPSSQVPAVYSWPGNGNPFFSNYYNFDMPYNLYGYAGFYDEFDDNWYNPSQGDYPSMSLRGCPFNRTVDELMWFAYNDAGPHTQSGGVPLNVEVRTQFLGIVCPEGSPTDRTVYVIYTIINRGLAPLDSAYFGVFLDFNIGNGSDDFIGSDPQTRVVYAYNGDPVDEGGFENTPPVMAVDLLRGPQNDQGEEVTQWHFVPVATDQLTSPEAYYHQLAGRKADGTPFPNNGLMYTGDPLNPNAWTEARDGNTPGERKALASFGPFNLLPGAVNEVVLGYAWVRKGSNGSVADNLSILKPTMHAVQGIFDNCMELFPACPGNVAVKAPAEAPSISISPNPFTDWIAVESLQNPLRTIVLYDALGRAIRTVAAEGATAYSLQTAQLPPGLYVVEVVDIAGSRRVVTLMHE